MANTIKLIMFEEKFKETYEKCLTNNTGKNRQFTARYNSLKESIIQFSKFYDKDMLTLINFISIQKGIAEIEQELLELKDSLAI